eukprot:TCALIF_10244-PA protein Name:"Protein of unknown function" AED:0.17 eAED:0.17 QI:0/1/0/1/1/0/2/0/111
MTTDELQKYDQIYWGFIAKVDYLAHVVKVGFCKDNCLQYASIDLSKVIGTFKRILHHLPCLFHMDSTSTVSFLLLNPTPSFVIVKLVSSSNLQTLKSFFQEITFLPINEEK